MSALLEQVVSDFVAEYGEGALLDAIRRAETHDSAEQETLTIVANAGVHPLQSLHQRGDVFIASIGNLDFSNSASAHAALRTVLVRVAKKLQERPWKRIYLVPFGPAILSMLIKSLAFKVLYIETIDVLHAGSGMHFDISIDVREIAIEASNTEDSVPSGSS